jgi:hypothetical protein
MYTTIIIIESNNQPTLSNLDSFLNDNWKAEIDREFNNIIQYTLISKHEPEFNELEKFVNELDDKELNVQYVCCDFYSAHIAATRRYCGVWYND